MPEETVDEVIERLKSKDYTNFTDKEVNTFMHLVKDKLTAQQKKIDNLKTTEEIMSLAYIAASEKLTASKALIDQVKWAIIELAADVRCDFKPNKSLLDADKAIAAIKAFEGGK